MRSRGTVAGPIEAQPARASRGNSSSRRSAQPPRRALLRIQPEQVEAPGRQVEIEAASGQLVALAAVARGTEQVDEVMHPAAERRDGQLDVALRLVRLEVHHAQQPARRRALPGEADEAVPASSCPARPRPAPAAARRRRATPGAAGPPAGGRRRRRRPGRPARPARGPGGSRRACGAPRTGPGGRTAGPASGRPATAAAWCTSQGKVPAARGSSWFSRKRTRWRW